MSKQAANKSAVANVVAGTAATRANRKPSKGISKPQGALAQAAATLGATAPAQPASVAPTVVALRGQAAVASVQIKAGAVYKTKAPHNLDWWAIITKAAASQPAAVADLCKAGVPSHFIGYTLRRGYLVAA